MKKFLVLSFLILVLPSIQANAYPPLYLSGPVIWLSCAPEATDGNIRAAESAIDKLAKEPGFKDASEFQKFVKEIQAQTSPGHKFAGFLVIAGVCISLSGLARNITAKVQRVLKKKSNSVKDQAH